MLPIFYQEVPDLYPAGGGIQLIRGMFEMNCLFLSGDFKFQVSPKVLISCPRSTPRG